MNRPLAAPVASKERTRAVIAVSGAAVRTYAHELRKSIWSTLFGITGKVRAASHLQKAIKCTGSEPPNGHRRILGSAGEEEQLSVCRL